MADRVALEIPPTVVTPLSIFTDHLPAAWTFNELRLVGIVHVRFIGQLAVVKLIVVAPHFHSDRNCAICAQDASNGSTSSSFIIVAASLFAFFGSG